MRSGIWLIILAMSMTPALDAVAKILSARYDPIFISFVRYLSAGLIALSLASLRRERIALRRDGLMAQLFRTGLMMGAMTCFITALSMVPLADAVGGFLIAPMVATAISVLLMGESMTARKGLGALLSVLGAAAIMRPGLGLETGTLLALGGGVLLGCYFAASRGASHAEDVLAAMAVQSLLGATMVAPLAFAQGVPDLGWDLAFWALVLGAISAACHSLTILAFRRSEASVLAPFMYFNLFVAVAIGIFVFGEVPVALTWVGLAAILAGGVVTALPASAIAWLMGPVKLPQLPQLPQLPAIPALATRPGALSAARTVGVTPRLPAAATLRAGLSADLAARMPRYGFSSATHWNQSVMASRSRRFITPIAAETQRALRLLYDEWMTLRPRRGLIPIPSS